MVKMYDVFIGSYGTEREKTIYWLQFAPDSETFTEISAISGVDHPSFIVVNNAKTHLYAVSEVNEGEVVSYKIDYQQQTLQEINRQPTKGGPCFLEVDENDRYLYTANYGGGSIIVHPLHEDGQIGSHSDFHHYDSSEQISNAHAIKNIPGTNSYAVTDLGHDKVYIYRHKAGKLEFITELKTKQGAGPRHIAFHPTLNVMYILNQDESTTYVYTYDEKAEIFKWIQTVPTLIEPFSDKNYAADIHHSGQFLYVSNRGHHSITAYRILTDGQLQVISNLPSGGEWPRNFAIDPNNEYVIVANEHTNNLNVMKITEDGGLQNTEKEFQVNKPVCICFV